MSASAVKMTPLHLRGPRAVPVTSQTCGGEPREIFFIQHLSNGCRQLALYDAEGTRIADVLMDAATATNLGSLLMADHEIGSTLMITGR